MLRGGKRQRENWHIVSSDHQLEEAFYVCMTIYNQEHEQKRICLIALDSSSSSGLIAEGFLYWYHKDDIRTNRCEGFLKRTNLRWDRSVNDGALRHSRPHFDDWHVEQGKKHPGHFNRLQSHRSVSSDTKRPALSYSGLLALEERWTEWFGWWRRGLPWFFLRGCLSSFRSSRGHIGDID